MVTEDDNVYCLKMNQLRKVSDDDKKEDETNGINEVKTPAKKKKRLNRKRPRLKCQRINKLIVAFS